MKKRFSATALAYGAIGAAISLLAVTAAFYVQNMSLTFNILAACGMLVPLSKQYYREAILGFVAVSAIGAIYTTVYILPFVLVTGSYTIASIICYEKKLKLYITLPIAIAWSCFVFCVLYYLTNVLYIDIDGLSLGNLSSGLIYFLFNLIFTAAFIIYHFGIIWVYQYAVKLSKKIKSN